MPQQHCCSHALPLHRLMMQLLPQQCLMRLVTDCMMSGRVSVCTTRC